MGTSGSFPGIKWPESEGDHWTSFFSDTKNEWNSTSSVAPVQLHSVHWDNFTFMSSSDITIS